MRYKVYSKLTDTTSMLDKTGLFLTVAQLQQPEKCCKYPQLSHVCQAQSSVPCCDQQPKASSEVTPLWGHPAIISITYMSCRHCLEVKQKEKGLTSCLKDRNFRYLGHNIQIELAILLKVENVIIE